MRVGFLGLGVMGTPMAMNLARKSQLTVWNRSASKCLPLQKVGARIAATPAEAVAESDIIFVMLFDGPAIQSILDDGFKKALGGKILVNTSSVPADFSRHLAKEVQDAGGHFIEMPVSGSKGPAEQGQLVGMMAGDPVVAERIRPVLEPITATAVYCGPIGTGLMTKYAVNLVAITMTCGLGEAMNLARAQGLNLEAFKQILDAGPMASAYSKVKTSKMLSQDWSAQAGIADCYNSTQLIETAAKESKAQAPLIHLCGLLYKHAVQSGLGDEDMIAVHKVFADPSLDTSG
ncbi:hypothetical protein F4775DRAFT_595646 [Biscogniauxia sp. FL1348]|nr:hypothetical protein F4775DRAFT_595646 [Biscogniauxia sp. FL1348]